MHRCLLTHVSQIPQMTFDIRVKILETGSQIILNYSQLKFPENDKKKFQSIISIVHLVFHDAKIRFDPSTTLQFRARDLIIVVRKSAGWSVGLLVGLTVDWSVGFLVAYAVGLLVGRFGFWWGGRLGRLN